jgi:hypothetical protein
MSKSDGGKGSSPRPFSVSEEEYAQKWERIFGKKDIEKIVENAKEYLIEKGADIHSDKGYSIGRAEEAFEAAKKREWRGLKDD